MTSTQACEAAARGVMSFDPHSEVTQLPLSDGGEGFASCMASLVGAEARSAKVHDPLMREIEAVYYVSADGTAYMDVASVVGLSLVAPEERDIFQASSAGVGEMLLDAVSAGCRRIVIGLGGSVTCDAGAGIFSVLGGKLSSDVEVIAAADVNNPLYGPLGAAYVFALQKGALPQQLPELDRRLRHFDSKMQFGGYAGPDLAEVAGAGAAGGIGYALMALAGARIVPGLDIILDAAGFDRILEGTDLVFTGEGSSDSQTLMGKAPYGLMRRCKAAGIPVALLSGKISGSQSLVAEGFCLARSINERFSGSDFMNPSVAMTNLAQTVYNTLCDPEDCTTPQTTTIRRSVHDDIPRMMEIFGEAKTIMRADGNLHQWTDNYPDEEVVRRDIALDNSYVVIQDGEIVGTFAFIPGVEKTYLNIYDGEWLEDTLPYATIHRLASTVGSHGVASACFEWAWERVRNLRVDTHRDNRIMQHCISKAGFIYCGIIYLENGDERLAYQKINQL